jgi:hypothetical protein
MLQEPTKLTVIAASTSHAGLVSLCMRHNLLTDVSAWAGAACKATLQDLEFRDNQITQVRIHKACDWALSAMYPHARRLLTLQYHCH